MRRGWDLIKGRCTDTRNSNNSQKCSAVTDLLSPCRNPHYRPREEGGGARYVWGIHIHRRFIGCQHFLELTTPVRDCSSRPYPTRKFFDGFHTQGDRAIRSESEISHPRNNVGHFLPIDAVKTARHESTHIKCTANDENSIRTAPQLRN